MTWDPLGTIGNARWIGGGQWAGKTIANSGADLAARLSGRREAEQYADGAVAVRPCRHRDRRDLGRRDGGGARAGRRPSRPLRRPHGCFCGSRRRRCSPLRRWRAPSRLGTSRSMSRCCTTSRTAISPRTPQGCRGASSGCSTRCRPCPVRDSSTRTKASRRSVRCSVPTTRPLSRNGSACPT